MQLSPEALEDRGFNCKENDLNATPHQHDHCLHTGVGPDPYSPYLVGSAQNPRLDH